MATNYKSHLKCKWTIKPMLALLLTMLSAQTLSAYDFKVDGIYYKINNGTKVSVSVTSKRTSAPYNDSEDYSGFVKIPSSVSYEGISYEVISIGEYAFSGCLSLTAIEIPNSVFSIGEYAFSGCSSLTAIEIPNSVNSVYNGVFSGCISLTKVKLPNNITTISSYFFQNCTNLNEITIPVNINFINSFAFNGCINLTKVIIEDGNTPLNMGYNKYGSENIIRPVDGKGLFYDCPITHVYMGRNLSYNKKYAAGSSPFYGIPSITNISIGKNVTFIESDLFYGSNNLHVIEVDAENNTYDSRENCNAIIETSSNTLIKGSNNTFIPNSITSIGNNALSDCVSPTFMEFPSSVTSIGFGQFRNSSNLKYIICRSNNPPQCSSTPFPDGIIAIVPPSALNAYASATGWQNLHFNVNAILANTTQATITLQPSFDFISNIYAEIEGKVYSQKDSLITITGLSPNRTYIITTYGQFEDVILESTISAKTKTVTPYLNLVSSTNNTLTLKGSYDAGDATVEKTVLADKEGDEITVTGLEPGEEYSYTYYVYTKDGSSFYATNKFSTKPITFQTKATTTATHCNLEGEYSVIDAEIIEYGFTDYPNQKKVDLYGLDPSRTYTSTFYVRTKSGKNILKI